MSWLCCCRLRCADSTVGLVSASRCVGCAAATCDARAVLRCASRAAGACDARAKLLQLALSGGRAAVACDVWDVQLRQLAMHGPCGGVGRAAATCAARAVLWQLVMRRPCGCDLRCVGRAARGEQKRARQGEVIAGGQGGEVDGWGAP